jgi:hypothetical protein
VDDGRPVAACVMDPALTGFRGTGIVVSCAQGALGLLPFAVRLGDLRVAGVHLLATQHEVVRKVAAPSREGQPNSVRQRAGSGKGDTPDRGGRTIRRGRDRESPPAGPAPQHDQQSNTFESTTQRR